MPSKLVPSKTPRPAERGQRRHLEGAGGFTSRLVAVGPTARLLDRVLRLLPYGNRPIPLGDSAPDPGLFGPGSVTWTVMREPLLLLGGGRALLLQAAHPLVAQGAIDHSTYATDPFGRLQRTIHWVTMVSFGTTAEARTASEAVNRLHRSVRGRLPRRHATSAVASGTPYRASDPRLLQWVHATFVDTMLVTYEALVGDLPSGADDEFVREWNAVAELMGVPPRRRWRSREALAAYVDEQVSTGPARPGHGSRLVARTILAPPVPAAARPLWSFVAFATVGLLPAPTRSGYGIAWSPVHTAAHQGLCLSLRAAHPVLPRRLRISPVYDAAMARVARRGRQVA